MTFEERRAAALALLEKTGIRRSSYAPPIFRLLWRIGINARPPHFAGFFANFILSGLYFGAIWGLFMWLVIWSPQGMAISLAASAAFIAGLLFGLAMAVYYRYSAQKHSLPKWDDINGLSAMEASGHK